MRWQVFSYCKTIIPLWLRERFYFDEPIHCSLGKYKSRQKRCQGQQKFREAKASFPESTEEADHRFSIQDVIGEFFELI